LVVGVRFSPLWYGTARGSPPAIAACARRELPWASKLTLGLFVASWRRAHATTPSFNPLFFDGVYLKFMRSSGKSNVMVRGEAWESKPVHLLLKKST
jgi:hypothetical protein